MLQKFVFAIIVCNLCQFSIGNVSFDDRYNECNKSRRCFTIPAKCTKDCTVLLTVKPFANGSAEFELIWKISEGNDWVGTGLSTGNKMSADTAMVYGVILDNQFNIHEGITTDEHMRVTDAESDPKIQITGAGSIENGYAIVKWIRNAKTKFQGKEFDLMEKQYFVLLAFGKTTGVLGKIHDPGQNIAFSESAQFLGKSIGKLPNTTKSLPTIATMKHTATSKKAQDTTKFVPPLQTTQTITIRNLSTQSQVPNELDCVCTCTDKDKHVTVEHIIIKKYP